jgi:hypothetical protein
VEGNHWRIADALRKGTLRAAANGAKDVLRILMLCRTLSYQDRMRFEEGQIT